MATPALPTSMLLMLASQAMREHHAFWHAGREWDNLSPRVRAYLEQRSYHAPRQAGEAGSGLDFLGMHRKMIEMVNQHLADLNVQEYLKVIGWKPIPFNHQDADYPMPPAWPVENARLAAALSRMKSQDTTLAWQEAVAEKYENDAWLRGRSLDEIGIEIESGIHNWLHMHWSAEPWFKGLAGQDENDVKNDYLGSTYSSHVNKVFWKLHGWIDDRIGQWEQANQKQADLSGAWNGPHDDHHHMIVSKNHNKAGGKAHSLIPQSLRDFSDTFFVR